MGRAGSRRPVRSCSGSSATVSAAARVTGPWPGPVGGRAVAAEFEPWPFEPWPVASREPAGFWEDWPYEPPPPVEPSPGQESG
jgi:hypothetical protein